MTSPQSSINLQYIDITKTKNKKKFTTGKPEQGQETLPLAILSWTPNTP